MKTAYDELYRIVIGGKSYYTNGYTIVSEEDVNKVQKMLASNEIDLYNKTDNIVQTVLSRANVEKLHSIGINYAPIQTFANSINH